MFQVAVLNLPVVANNFVISEYYFVYVIPDPPSTNSKLWLPVCLFIFGYLHGQITINPFMKIVHEKKHAMHTL